MGFRLIKGTYRVAGFSPDGDSLRFVPDDVNQVLALQGPRPANLNQGDSVQLRLEAIDALETHYTQGAADMRHQPPGVARGALDFLLKALDITDVIWNADHTKVEAAKDGVPGYILSRTFEQNRRPVAFAFAGQTAAPDGDDVFLEGGLLRESVNYALLAEGLVYATYYEGLFASLRRVMDQAASRARTARAAGSVWAIDATESGVTIPPRSATVDTRAVMPKLFRRLSQYFKSPVAHDLSGFPAFLQSSADPCIFIPDADPTHFHRFVEVKGNRVRLTVPPEHLMFMEK